MEPILQVVDLQVAFQTLEGRVQAIRGVSFHVQPGEILALVGESGSGKSVSTKAITRILPPKTTQIEHGEIWYQGEDLLKKTEKAMLPIRGKEIAMIFQDPMTSLNPTMTVGSQIAEAIREHQKISKAAAKQQAIELLNKVGIVNAAKRYGQYPHQFSGGMRQRIMIAIALACKPKVLIADEPTTALDVTIQAQIIELLKELNRELQMAIIFITHDLGVVANIANRVAVMYAGKIIEIGTANDIFYHPQHPYTWGLLASMPTLEIGDQDLYTIPGSPPNLMELPSGDPFAPRNQYALDIDFIEEPPMLAVSPTHQAATWLLSERAPQVEPPADIQRRYSIFAKLINQV